MKVRYLSLIIAATLSNHLLAQEIQELETTEVTAQEKSQYKVLSEELVNKQVNDIKGVFNESAAVDVSNSVRYSQKTYIRGVEEHSANVTIDGARQDGQMFHHAGNQMVDTSMLKSVSVELGAASVLSGYGANVGAIKYETLDPQDMLASKQKFGFKTAAAMDTATEFKQGNASFYGMLTEKLSALATVNWNESGDIETPDKDPIVNKHSELKSGIIKLVYDFSDVEQLDFSAQHYEDSGHRAFSGEKPGATTLEEAPNFNGYIRDTYTLKYHNNSNNPLLDLSVDAYFNEKKMNRGAASGDHWYRDDNGEWQTDGIEVVPERDYSYKTLGLNIRNTFLIDGIAWTAGIESFKSKQAIDAGLKQTTLSNGTTTSSNMSVNKGPESSLIGSYVQAEFEFGDFSVIPGVRYDYYSLSGAYDSSFNQVSPKLAVNWQANKDLNFNLGYGRIFKGPGLPEILMIKEGMTQSVDAKAETGDHFELNVMQDLQSALNVDSASSYVNIYQYTIDDYYHPTKNTSLVRGRYDLTMKGVEAGFNMSHQDLSAYINYSYNTGENSFAEYTSDNLYSGTQVIKIGVDYQVIDSILIGWNSNFYSGADLVEKEVNREGQLVTYQVNKSGYGVSNFWLNYQMAQIEGLSFKLAVENVFDKAYQNHNSFGMYWGNDKYNDNEVGRNFKLAASYQF